MLVRRGRRRPWGAKGRDLEEPPLDVHALALLHLPLEVVSVHHGADAVALGRAPPAVQTASDREEHEEPAIPPSTPKTMPTIIPLLRLVGVCACHCGCGRGRWGGCECGTCSGDGGDVGRGMWWVWFAETGKVEEKDTA